MCRDLDWRSPTANYELMLMKVRDEVSMRLCFRLTAVIGTRQERLPSLLVDPACKLNLRGASTCRVKHSPLAEIEGCRRCRVAAITVTLREPLSFLWCKCVVFFSHSSSRELSHGVVMSLARQRAAHTVEHR